MLGFVVFEITHLSNYPSNIIVQYFQPRSYGPWTASNIQIGFLGTGGLGHWSIQSNWRLGSFDWSKVENEFISRESNSSLLIRCWEVSFSRERNITGSQQDYNRMCQEMPQHLRIAFFHQQEMPPGYDSGAFGGVWPPGIVTV